MRNRIADLFHHDGPFASVYLDARSDQPNAQQVLATRWKSARAALSAEGATDDDLGAIDAAVASATHKGGDTFAAFASGGELRFVRHLPDPPTADAWRLGLLPWVGPLVEAAQHLLPHVLVLAERSGAEIHGMDALGHERDEEVVASTNEDVELIKVGGWSQRRFEQRQVNTWEENAKEVADEVASVAEQVGARLVGVRGDVHAVRLLRDALPHDVAALVRPLEAEARVLVDTVVAEELVAVLEVFREERGQHDRAADGPARTVEALQQATVQTLLVHDDPADDRMAWIGPEPTQLALDEATLHAMGVERPVPARLVDACVRAAYGTSADVWIAPGTVLTDAVGAVLRHAGNRPGVPR
jgi:hypothetical protein